jgi:hypothetical protein
MDWTDEQIGSLIRALPPIEDEPKRGLLPLILGEWARVDLETHLTRPGRKEARDVARRFGALAKHAHDLAAAIADLDEGLRHVLGYRLARLASDRAAARGSDEQLVGHDQAKKHSKSLADEVARVERIAAAARDLASRPTDYGHHHNTIVRYLILKDLAAIFEYATGKRARRGVRSEDHPDYGQDYGPFYEFAKSVWQLLFGDTAGLSANLKLWAEARRRYDERSAVIANIQLRHPEWRIFPR